MGQTSSRHTLLSNHQLTTPSKIQKPKDNAFLMFPARKKKNPYNSPLRRALNEAALEGRPEN
jgi:hypothetical protein